MAASMSRAFGRPISYAAIPPAVFRSFGFPGADDLGNMFQVYTEFAKEWGAARDVGLTRALNPALQTFDQWLAEYKGLVSLT